MEMITKIKNNKYSLFIKHSEILTKYIKKLKVHFRLLSKQRNEIIYIRKISID